MAGEWIKVRTNLWDDPRIGRLCEMTDQGEAAVIGGLYWLWATADEHSSDGLLHGMTTRTIDRKTGVTGLGNALVAIGWLSESEDGVTVLRFDEHNGASAKTRAQTAKRVANHKGNAKVTQEPLPESDKTVSDALPREDKIREELKPLKSKAEAATASRLPAGWVPSGEDIEYCKTQRPDLLPSAVAENFRDYWASLPNTEKSRKSDWHATWRSWIRKERATVQPRASPQGYESAKDRSRREASEQLTGRKHDQRNEFIDITPRSVELG